MAIIVEGLDNTGKTTLVERLQQDFPELEYFPSIGNKHDLEHIRAQAAAFAFKDESQPLALYDRCRFISEYIYNPILKARDLAFPFKTWFGYLWDFTERPQLVIYCRRDAEEVLAGFDDREQLEGVAANLDKLNLAYARFMEMLFFLFSARPDKGSEVFIYDFETMPYEAVHRRVATYIERMSA